MGKIKTQISDLSTKLTLRAISSSRAYNAWDLFASSYGLLPLRETKLQPLSSVEASLCCREAGEKEWRVRWARWEGEREKRRPVPRALSIFFDYCYFYWDTQRESLRGRDLQPLLLCKTCSLSTFKKPSCERRDINNRLIL